MIDACTLGSKGNVQVVVPMQSESYGSSMDPPEPDILVCTLKNFPYDYDISHTIQWGRDLFDGLFQCRPTQAIDNISYLQNNVQSFAKLLLAKLGEDAALQAAKEIGEDLSCDYFYSDSDDVDDILQNLKTSSVQWAIKLADTLFHRNVKDLLRQHPPKSLDEDGEPFWSGTRLLPIVITYNNDDIDEQQEVMNRYIVDFVVSAARLRMEMYLVEESLLEKYASSFVTVEDAITALEQFEYNDTTVDDQTVISQGDSNGDTTQPTLLSKLTSYLDNTIQTPPKTSNNNPFLNIVEFEKDDETNGHVAFITSASNLRALVYGITPVDAMETRRIAGRIIPAMITTTAFVSALSCMELVKMVAEVPLHLHKNAFVNLALPFFAFTSPLPAEERMGLHGKTYTLWDRIVIKEKKKLAENGGMTLKQLLNRIKKKIQDDNLDDDERVNISTVSYGPYMIYASFLQDEDDNIMQESIWDLVKDAMLSGDDDIIDDEDGFMLDLEGNGADAIMDHGDVDENDIGVEIVAKELNGSNNGGDGTDAKDLDNKAFLDFVVVVEEEESGEEIELPLVRVIKWKNKTQ